MSRGLAPLLVAFATASTLVAVLGMVAAHRPEVAAAVAVAAAVGCALCFAGRFRAGAAVLVPALLLVPQAVLISRRPRGTPVQDGLLLAEAAARRLLAGLPPYGHDYIDDPALRTFFAPELPVNPLLGHFVFPPGLALLMVPSQALGVDGAWTWLPGVALLAWSAHLAAGRAGFVAVALSPALLLDQFNLFNDLFFLAAGLASFGCLRRRRALEAGALFAAALLLKQLAVVLLPAIAYGLLAWLDGRGRTIAAMGAVTVLAAGLVPFLVWTPGALAGDLAAYFLAGGVDGYPAHGPGLYGWAVAAGSLPSRWAPAPVLLAVAGIAIGAALAGAAIALLRGSGERTAWAWTAVLAAAVFMTGRSLAPNYVSVAAVPAAIALALWLDERAPGRAAVAAAEHGPTGDPGVEAAPA